MIVSIDLDEIHKTSCKIAMILEDEGYTVDEARTVAEEVKSIIQHSKFKMPASERIISLNSAYLPKIDPPVEPFDIDKFLLRKEKELKQSMDEFVSKLR